jgi:hypothetical protein
VEALGRLGPEIHRTRHPTPGQERSAAHQIRINRVGQPYFSRSVIGHSEESLREATRVRDEALRSTTARRANQIPPRVLRALGLSSAVLGITRLPSRSVYRVEYTDAAGRRRTRQFYFRAVPEEDAYAAAIIFLESIPK